MNTVFTFLARAAPGPEQGILLVEVSKAKNALEIPGELESTEEVPIGCPPVKV